MCGGDAAFCKITITTCCKSKDGEAEFFIPASRTEYRRDERRTLGDIRFNDYDCVK